MRKLFTLAPWFVAVTIAWCLGYAYNIYGGGELSWLRIMYGRKSAIAAQINAPRRLLVTGGSGAHYTINSKLIEQELGIPVVNLGLDGKVALNVIVAGAQKQIRPGDTLLVIAEYPLLQDPDGFDERSATFGIAIGQPGLANVPIKQFIQDGFLLGVPSLRSLAKSSVDLIEKGKLTGYYSGPLTDRGDPIEVKKREGKWWKMTIDQPISKHAIDLISQLKKEVEAKGAHLVVSLPWIYAKTDDPKTIRNVTKTAEELSKIVPLIYDPKTLNLQSDSSLFADTHFHLLPPARIIRSKQIVEEIKPILSRQ